jgi:hypothetical protein
MANAPASLADYSQGTYTGTPALPPAAVASGGMIPAGPFQFDPNANPTDPAYVRKFVDYLATLPNADPQLKNDPNYYVQQIIANGGGVTQDNANYWQGHVTNPQNYGGNGGGSGANGDPQSALEGDPGYQARLAAGMEAVQKSAAAKGDLLTGGTLKDLTQFGQTFGSNEFQNVFNRNLSAAQLGLGATENANAAGSGYSTNAAGTVEGQGNAQAAGTVASGNAAAGATGTVTNAVNQAAQNWSKLPQAQPVGVS